MADGSGILDNVGRNIAVIGSIVAAIVGMNSALASCSAETVARHQTFRQATEAEEQYWRGLYSDYLATFRRDVGPDEREARLFALGVLAERQVPKFEEYSLGWFDKGQARTLASTRLDSMKARLLEALSRKESSTPAVAEKQQEQAFESAVQNRVRTDANRKAEQAEPAPPVIADVSPDAGVSYQTQILARGSPKGWDLDMFWCGGGESAVEGDNYRRGLLAARRLAELSSSNAVVGGERLGRVRLVMLPEQRQGGDYPWRSYGNEIRSDRDAPELAFARQLQKTIPGGASFRLRVNDPPPSKYYLSLFSCATGQAPEGRPAPRSPVGPQPALRQ